MTAFSRDLYRSAACGSCQFIYLPIPSVVVLIAAGALSARGEMRISIIVPLGILACLAADSIWFWFGRRWGSQAMRLLCRLTADPRECSRNAHEKFSRYGLALVCVAKFFPGLGAVIPPLVGAEGVALARFLAFDTLGGFLWTGFYVGLGYLFSNEVSTLPFAGPDSLGPVVAIGISGFRSVSLSAGVDWFWCE